MRADTRTGTGPTVFDTQQLKYNDCHSYYCFHHCNITKRRVRGCESFDINIFAH